MNLKKIEKILDKSNEKLCRHKEIKGVLTVTLTDSSLTLSTNATTPEALIVVTSLHDAIQDMINNAAESLYLEAEQVPKQNEELH